MAPPADLLHRLAVGHPSGAVPIDLHQLIADLHTCQNLSARRHSWALFCFPTDLHFVTPGGRSPFHQPQHVQAHVVLAAPSQAEAEARRPAIQVHAVIPGVTLGDEEVQVQSATVPTLTLASSPSGASFDPFCFCQPRHARARTGWTSLGKEDEG